MLLQIKKYVLSNVTPLQKYSVMFIFSLGGLYIYTINKLIDFLICNKKILNPPPKISQKNTKKGKRNNLSE